MKLFIYFKQKPSHCLLSDGAKQKSGALAFVWRSRVLTSWVTDTLKGSLKGVRGLERQLVSLGTMCSFFPMGQGMVNVNHGQWDGISEILLLKDTAISDREPNQTSMRAN